MSVYSPGPVEPEEVVARFAFAPLFFDKKGKLKPNIFQHVFSAGCSIQRDSVASDSELTTFVNTFLSSGEKFSWRGVVTTDCATLRNLKISESSLRSLCVYDTGEPGNPAHGEMCQSQHLDVVAHGPELRNLLFEAFNADNVMTPEDYREGKVWSGISEDLRRRA